MSNTNTIVEGIIARLISSSCNGHGDLTNSARTARKLKTVYVGSNQYPISITELYEILVISWKKKAGCGLLTSPIGSLSGSHSVSDLITLVDKKMSQWTHNMHYKIQKKKMKVMKSAFIADNLSASAFLNAPIKVMKLIL